MSADAGHEVGSAEKTDAEHPEAPGEVGHEDMAQRAYLATALGAAGHEDAPTCGEGEGVQDAPACGEGEGQGEGVLLHLTVPACSEGEGVSDVSGPFTVGGEGLDFLPLPMSASSSADSAGREEEEGDVFSTPVQVFPTAALVEGDESAAADSATASSVADPDVRGDQRFNQMIMNMLQTTA